MSTDIHKLTLVSKILLDRELLRLRRDNERLRLVLFWKDHNEAKLRELMLRANHGLKGPRCKCLACALSGRMYQEEEIAESTTSEVGCAFKPWFEAHFASCGLTAKTDASVLYEDAGVKHMCSAGVVHNVDSHIHYIACDDWLTWTYGARLWKCQSARDPELVKLRTLFKRLEKEAGNASGRTPFTSYRDSSHPYYQYAAEDEDEDEDEGEGEGEGEGDDDEADEKQE